NFFVRVGMMNPDYVLKILDELIEAMKEDKIFRFIHIPVQSGNNKVLKSMNRRYTAEDFRRIIRRFREEIPDMTVSTDIICGFPGETEEQFNDSVELIKEIRPDVLNISRFWPRPGTPAESMEQFPTRITKERSQKLTKAFHDIAREKNRAWIGWKGKVLIDEKGKAGTGTMIGRNYAYKPVVVRAAVNPRGSSTSETQGRGGGKPQSFLRKNSEKHVGCPRCARNPTRETSVVGANERSELCPTWHCVPAERNQLTGTQATQKKKQELSRRQPEKDYEMNLGDFIDAEIKDTTIHDLRA
ncbi:MAG: radical SAM protein, partial [Candidatus Woesearchaeota archaeon]